MRKCGILMPITSLPSRYGIGCFSKEAYKFVDFLRVSGQSYWQILPLGPTGYGDSPYQSFSTFAGNPYMIDIEDLINDGLLSRDECDSINFGDEANKVDYGKQFTEKIHLIKKAFERYNHKTDVNFEEFILSNQNWLDDYSLFMALKYHFSQNSWNMWSDDIKNRKPQAMRDYMNKLENNVNFWRFIQYKFYTQWKKLKEYANKNGISIIGDLPIYVSYDSADVWSDTNLFELDSDSNPLCVAGCPPDGFSPKGQLWGNPIYNWKEHKSSGYTWWIRRMSHALGMYDMLRIDHFRGFDEYYSIKYPSPDATQGKWCKGPGKELFDAFEKSCGKCNIIAEDLGFITKSVKELLSSCGYPGMKILEFAFDSRDTGESSDYLPHNYSSNCVAYTGTHDNMTISSWFDSINPDKQKEIRMYLCDNCTPKEEIYYPLIGLIMRSCANLCIIPIQDWLGLDDSARINIPSKPEGNWSWRLSEDMLTDDLQNKMYNLAKLCDRL